VSVKVCEGKGGIPTVTNAKNVLETRGALKGGEGGGGREFAS